MNHEIINSDICFACEIHHTSKQTLDDYMYVSHKRISSKCAEKSEKHGRGRNGMAFIYNSDIILSSPIEYYGNRIAVMEMDPVVIIGVYLSYNDGNEASRQELQSDLVTLKELINQFKLKSKETIIVGDTNVDFIKINKFTNILVDFLIDTDYIVGDIEYGPQQVDYTWHSIRYNKQKNNEPYLITSWVDHLLVHRTSKLVTYVGIIESSENKGDHNSIRFTIKAGLNSTFVNTEPVKIKPFKPNLDWRNKVAVDEYSERVNIELLKLDFQFKSLHLLNPTSNQMENQLTSALNALHDTMVHAKSRLINLYAYTKRPKRKYGLRSKSWWCETLQHYMEQMRLTFVAYKYSGYQQNLKEPYREAKRLFRCRKRYNILLKRNKNIKKLDDLFKLDRDSFWKKIKSSQRIKQIIDMPLEEAKKEYEELFNVSFPHKVNKDKIKQELETMLDEPQPHDDITMISQLNVETIMRELKNGKATGYHGISNEMVKYALSEKNNKISECYTIIFNKIIETSTVPRDFNISVIKPLIKDAKKPSTNKSNLRPVAVSNVSDTMFEKAVAIKVRIQCKTSEKQFGFKKKSSCAHAIFVMKQVIKYARALNTRVYMCAIDASKAFDKVIRLVLWWKLAKKGLNRKLLKALIAYYDSSKMRVQVNEKLSDIFSTSEGTKQGGPISPDFFNEYGDELASWISELNVGISMGSLKIDIIQYADDITLVSNTARGLQQQIDVCNRYGEEYGIQFNPDKTMVIVFNQSCDRSIEEIINDDWKGEFRLAGKTIEIVTKLKILGQILSDDGKDIEHVGKRKAQNTIMLTKLQSLNLNSIHICPFMKSQMFKTYIRPVLTSGSENMSLTGHEILEFKKLEGIAIKNLLRIPSRCHTTNLVDALNIEQTNRYLHRMKLKFLIRLSEHELTRKILEFSIETNFEGSFTSEIAKYLRLGHDYDLDCMLNQADTVINNLKKSKKANK